MERMNHNQRWRVYVSSSSQGGGTGGEVCRLQMHLVYFILHLRPSPSRCTDFDDLYAIPHTGATWEQRWKCQIPNHWILGAWKGGFKPNSHNIKTSISKFGDSYQILHNDNDHQILFVGGPNTRTTNLRWRTAAIVKTLISQSICQQRLDRSPRNLAWWRISSQLSMNFIKLG